MACSYLPRACSSVPIWSVTPSGCSIISSIGRPRPHPHARISQANRQSFQQRDGGAVVSLLRQRIGEKQFQLGGGGPIVAVVGGLQSQQQMADSQCGFAAGQILPAEIDLQVEMIRVDRRGVLEGVDGALI